MRKTGIATLCDKCNEEFEMFADDGHDDNIVIWNYCSFCGERKDLWLRFMRPNEISVRLGIGYKEAQELKNKPDEFGSPQIETKRPDLEEK